MTTYVVTRHEGALDWLKNEGVVFDQHLLHLEIGMLKKNDVVVGNLPIPIVAEINKLGVVYKHLSFNVPFALRGRELTAQELKHLDANLRVFYVTEMD
ncbi:CRISPR-associated protein Csx16 [Thiomicrospira sp. R3]|uniref:CRISPR-associated protein Csx16 n=1 Tax=Thiomicrospira sp. R3 TaxID=3035472 RepID=UPI00259B2AF2|nr:CRISPR-associated protein Csx16 [Thiomicrospira sp. R3]WFE69473.1 CRISPR-associated protein Csx16 [Thiomicrospira sp. R3]